MGMETVVCGDGWGPGWLLRGLSGNGDDVETTVEIWVGMGMRVGTGTNICPHAAL